MNSIQTAFGCPPLRIHTVNLASVEQTSQASQASEVPVSLTAGRIHAPGLTGGGISSTGALTGVIINKHVGFNVTVTREGLRDAQEILKNQIKVIYKNTSATAGLGVVIGYTVSCAKSGCWAGPKGVLIGAGIGFTTGLSVNLTRAAENTETRRALLEISHILDLYFAIYEDTKTDEEIISQLCTFERTCATMTPAGRRAFQELERHLLSLEARQNAENSQDGDLHVMAHLQQFRNTVAIQRDCQ